MIKGKETQNNVKQINLAQLISPPLPNRDIRRVVGKLMSEYEPSSLNPIASTIDWTNIPPSEYSIMTCMKIFTEYCKSHAVIHHPANKLDELLRTQDCLVSFSGVSCGSTVYPSKLGMITDSMPSRIAGCYSSCLAFFTNETAKGIDTIHSEEVYNQISGIPRLDLVNERSAASTGPCNANKAREAIYARFYQKPEAGLIASDLLYRGPLKDFSRTSSTLKEIVNQAAVDIHEQYSAAGACPTVMSTEFVGMDFNYTYLYTCRAVSDMARGGDGSGRGSITAGYYFFDCTSYLAKAYLLSVDVIAMLVFYKMRRVRIETNSKDFGIMFIRILIANGYVVIGGGGVGMDPDDGKGGYYYRTTFSCMTIVNDCFVAPVFTSSGITFQTGDQFDSQRRAGFPNHSGLRVMYTHMSPTLEAYCIENDSDSDSDGKGLKKKKINKQDRPNLYMFPTSRPHTCKVWVTTIGPAPYDYSVLIQRAGHAMLHRNRFVLTRKPYWPYDECLRYFERDIIIPKMVVKKKSDKLVAFTQFKVESHFEPVEKSEEYNFIIPTQPKIMTAEQYAKMHLGVIFSSIDQEAQIKSALMVRKIVGEDVHDAMLEDNRYALLYNVILKMSSGDSGSSDAASSFVDIPEDELDFGNEPPPSIPQVNFLSMMGDKFAVMKTAQKNESKKDID